MSAELRRTIQELESKREALIEARERARTEHKSQIAAPSAYFDQTAANQARAALRRLEEQVAQVEERLAALRGQLPSPATVAAAQQHAEDQLRHAEAALDRLPEGAARFLEALEAAEAAGRELVALRAEVAASLAAVRDTANRYNLALHVPGVPTLDTRLATNIAAALVELAVGDQPGQVTESYLAAARAEYAPVGGAAS